MSDDFKREIREIGRRLKVRNDTKRSEQQDQLSRVEDAIKHWERGIGSDITQSVQDANTALAEAQAGVSRDCVEGTAGPVDSGERVAQDPSKDNYYHHQGGLRARAHYRQAIGN